MPSVIETPERVTSVGIYDLMRETLEQRESGRARLGWWRTLVQRLITSLTPAQRERHVMSFETAQDRFGAPGVIGGKFTVSVVKNPVAPLQV